MKAGIIQAGAMAGALAAIFGLFIMVGWDVPPYSSMARAEKMIDKIECQLGIGVNCKE